MFAILGLSCKKAETEVRWNQVLPGAGSQSSVRVIDLNGDGVRDIVLGAGKNEYVHAQQGIVAIDGESGTLLWTQESKDLVFGSATFYDVTDDEIPDIFIGGRSCILMGLDGATGDTLWTYNPASYLSHPILHHAQFNFYSSVLVADQNNNGYDDLLIQNGGNPKVGPGIGEGRLPGVLLITDSKTGQIIAGDTMPDGMESYMSPLAFMQTGDSEHSIVFGSGGESFSGNLYLAKLSSLRASDLSEAVIIASEDGHGFIAPPVVADINGDEILDIIAISHASTIFAINGKDLSELWHLKIPDTESSNSFAVGYFTNDATPDFFTFVSKGTWPNNTGSVQVMIDGATGEIAYQNELGCTGFSSAVAYDLNGDDISEVILSINEFDCQNGFSGDIKEIEHKLIAIDFATKNEYIIAQKKQFKNVFSTPWIGDLDEDGYLDIVYSQFFHHPPHITSFLGMEVSRISTHIKMRDRMRWGAYMGSQGNGVF
ncbi:MAG: hypothetical protein HKN76_19430 [Saprospiraceae bacterium]|nr:hypothetical protein [Saprospiraceae bacterium]